eukprot:7877988-Alexandrium_andersonii.AAC.1
MNTASSARPCWSGASVRRCCRGGGHARGDQPHVAQVSTVASTSRHDVELLWFGAGGISRN